MSSRSLLEISLAGIVDTLLGLVTLKCEKKDPHLRVLVYRDIGLTSHVEAFRSRDKTLVGLVTGLRCYSACCSDCSSNKIGFNQSLATCKCAHFVTLVYPVFCSCDFDLDLQTWPEFSRSLLSKVRAQIGQTHAHRDETEHSTIRRTHLHVINIFLFIMC